jgi:hypothetical protein
MRGSSSNASMVRTSVAGHGEGDAASRRRTVDHHRAGAADALLAADMRTGQQQFLAQEIGEVGARRDLSRDRLAIDRQGDRFHAVRTPEIIAARFAATKCTCRS